MGSPGGGCKQSEAGVGQTRTMTEASPCARMYTATPRMKKGVVVGGMSLPSVGPLEPSRSASARRFLWAVFCCSKLERLAKGERARDASQGLHKAIRRRTARGAQ